MEERARERNLPFTLLFFTLKLKSYFGKDFLETVRYHCRKQLTNFSINKLL